ncbi:MAG: C40 family peptidase [Chloroflexi bacterium]|nr:C40 family peptidase [Chloroflexota bacterium]
MVPRRAAVARGVVDMRAEPRDDAELVDQLHFGEGVTLLAGRGGWVYVQAEDHYFGWIPEGDAAAAASPNTSARVIVVALADVHERPDAGSAVVDRLPAGTWLPAQPRLDKAGWLFHPEGWIARDATARFDDLPHRPPTALDLIATAEAFVGVPYLWGGTTGLGLDCSGFVQQVYRLNGIGLDRDADQQAVEGRSVDAPIRGDLVFFGTERVTHVGIAVSDRSFLNAPETGKRVQLDDLGSRNVLAMRRYLPG